MRKERLPLLNQDAFWPLYSLRDIGKDVVCEQGGSKVPARENLTEHLNLSSDFHNNNMLLTTIGYAICLVRPTVINSPYSQMVLWWPGQNDQVTLISFPN